MATLSSGRRAPVPTSNNDRVAPPPPSSHTSSYASSASSSMSLSRRSAPTGFHMALQCFSFACVGKEASADKVYSLHIILSQKLWFVLICIVD
jgi:hypothetical protein